MPKPYLCRDCNHAGRKPGPDGKCPACGSADFRREGDFDDAPRPTRASNLKLALLIGLWAVLITQIYWKLYGE